MNVILYQPIRDEYFLYQPIRCENFTLLTNEKEALTCEEERGTRLEAGVASPWQ